MTRMLGGFIILILPAMLLGVAPRSLRAQDGNKDGKDRPAENRPQPAERPQEQPRPQPEARPPEQPRPQERPQSHEKPQEQPRPQPEAKPHEQPHPQEQPRPQERPQSQQRPQEQPPQRPQQRPQEQHQSPQQNTSRQEQNDRPQKQQQENGAHQQQRGQPEQRPSGYNANSGARQGGERGPQQAYRPPQQSSQQRAHSQQQARSFSQAQRVPQAQERTIFQQRRAGNWQADHRDWRARGGYQGYYIPETRFGLYFGRSHYFHLWGLPMVYVGGAPEFQYNGYWFELLDPVPDFWGPNWYQTDNVYIDWDPDDGGYYLYDTNFPDDRLAVEIDG